MAASHNSTADLLRIAAIVMARLTGGGLYFSLALMMLLDKR